MKKAQRRRGLGTALILAATASLVTLVAPAVASAAPTAPTTGCSLQKLVTSARADGIAGVMPAEGACSTGIKSNALINAPASGASSPFFPGANPPLLFNGTPGCGPSSPPAPCENGNLMMTNQTGPLVITPIFWNPGHTMSFFYKLVIEGYLGNVALASGSRSNVFSVLDEYSGNNGQVNYNVRLGFPIDDNDPLPASGCTLNPADTTGIYADGSGYNACLDDAQLRAEVDHVTAARFLPHNLNHIYVLYLPKGAESCILPGETTSVGPNGQFCTINYQPTSAYCAYHSEDLAHAVYANMPFPIYDSAAGPTCGTEFNFGEIQSPNHEPDADVEISPTSHEISEAITDPDTQSGYYTALPIGFEIGDLCAYIFGTVHGPNGAFFNQTINGFHYLTQQEFSNKDFAITGKGCVQNVRQEA